MLFFQMLITNDVALITFVPFAIMILLMAKQEQLFIPVIVLQTIAANLGSMFTPIGNLYNLYLYSAFSIPASKFLMTMLPLTAVSLVCLVLAALFLNAGTTVQSSESDTPISGKSCFSCRACF
ncbi:MAG: SLC13 family permease [Eubacterium sp.]